MRNDDAHSILQRRTARNGCPTETRRRVNKSGALRYTAFMAAQKRPEMRIVSLAPSATSILCAIVALRPMLVIGSVPYKQETVGKLLEQRLNFLAMNPRSLGDVYADIRLLGGIAGRASAAEALIRKMQGEFAEVARRA